MCFKSCEYAFNPAIFPFFRHAAKQIYTYIGEVCVSVNPYTTLNIYSDAIVAQYKGKSYQFYTVNNILHINVYPESYLETVTQ